MKLIPRLLLIAAIFSSAAHAQPGPGQGRRGAGGGMFDPARRSEMMVQRLAEEIGLSKDQRTQVKDIIDRAQSSAKPLQQELQDTRKLVKEAVKAGKKSDEIDALNQKLGATYSKLAALQSSAFADALKVLKSDQKEDADMLYDTLGMLGGSGGRGMGPGGFGGFGPPRGFGGRGQGGDRRPDNSAGAGTPGSTDTSK